MTRDRERMEAALPSYEIGEELGRGAFGVVLAARHRELRRDVAVKELPAAFAADPDVRARFLVEARLLASLDHPHIVPIYDYVEHEGLCLVVMERLTGGSVWNKLRTEGISAPQACAMTLATCAGLQNAHERGVLHRDIKPENLMLSASGVLKITDFGIAKVLGGASYATSTGSIIGTPAYIAPEQAQGLELGPPTDVYATATVLYELLSGRLPYPVDGADAATLLYRHVHEDPPPLNHVVSDLPAGIAAVTDRGLARDPAARHQTAEAFGVALAEAAGAAWGPGWPSRSGVPILAADTILAGSGGESSTGTTLDRRTALAKTVVRREPSSALPPPGGDTPPAGRLRGWRRRRTPALIAVGLLAAAAAVGTVLATSGGGSSGGGASPRGSVTTTLPTEEFAVNPTQGGPLSTVTVTSVGPCPPLPSNFANPSRVSVVIQNGPNDPNEMAYADNGIDKGGKWSVTVQLGNSVVPGHYQVLASCEAQSDGGWQTYYDRYAPVPFTITP